MPNISMSLQYNTFGSFCQRRIFDHVDLDNVCDQNQYQQGVKIKMSANPVNHLTVTHQNHCHAIPLNPLSRDKSQI